MSSSFSTLRQQIPPDCRHRAVSVSVCILPLASLFLWLFQPRNTGQQYENISLAVESKWTHPLAAALLSSPGSPGPPSIAIKAQPTEHRPCVPAVSSLGACLTPA